MKRPIPVYEPLYKLKPIAENIWIVDGDLIEMDAVVTVLPFSTRMTVIKLANSQLWCHSPIAPNEVLYNQLDALGPVAHLISPNKIHYAYIADWKKRYPEAIAWSSPGVEQRAAKQKIPVAFDDQLTDKTPEAWAGQIDQLIFKGSAFIEEAVFFHKASQTLILTDLIENFETEHFPSWLRRKAYKLARIAAPDGQTPIDYRMTFIGHQRQAKECLEKLLAWQSEKIILAHGRCFLENGSAELRRALRWIR
ncbi:DUF4336 domain-containing protein [Streptococcus panodentis]|uniref:DUF4336 domain-containing protein n=1 Tax=Streptococcus panodentis TaxID=1581472 RepID=A0ABS5AWZ4_9STRE|nr:DUF4336 domain-containing protein [Streptococcus panodentis]MBP2621085.1 DUF4336 domain-containing protein [Streptococcus panodentis]